MVFVGSGARTTKRPGVRTPPGNGAARGICLNLPGWNHQRPCLFLLSLGCPCLPCIMCSVTKVYKSDIGKNVGKKNSCFLFRPLHGTFIKTGQPLLLWRRGTISASLAPDQFYSQFQFSWHVLECNHVQLGLFENRMPKKKQLIVIIFPLKLVIWGVYPILRHTQILFWQLWGNQISTQPSSEHRPVDADWAACCCHQKLTDPPKAWETTVITPPQYQQWWQKLTIPVIYHVYNLQ